QDFRLLHTYRHGAQATQVRFSQNPRILKCLWSESKPHYVDVATGLKIPESRAAAHFKDVSLPSGTPVVEFGVNNQIELWILNKNVKRKIKTWQCDLVRIQTHKFSPDGRTLAVGGMSS